MRLICSLIFLGAVLSGAGCASTPVVAPKDLPPGLLSFIEDGKTTRQEVLLTLGMPSGTFEGERILTYQLWVDDEQRMRVVWPRRPGQRPFYLRDSHSLVLVFDADGVLEAHSLVGPQ